MPSASPPPRVSTLNELLEVRASEQPEGLLFTFLGEEEAEADTLTYAELARQAQRIAVHLQQQCQPGERAVLLYPPGLEYVAGLYGALLAGVVAVPVWPPEPRRLERTLPRLLAVARDAGATLALTTSQVLPQSQWLVEHAPELGALRWVATDVLPPGSERNWRRPPVSAESLALLQYTSGSTGEPKGVMLSHRNLLYNLRLISQAFPIGPREPAVLWLPPYHDMGLIAGLLHPLYRAGPMALMSPLAFLERPLRWLQALSRLGARAGGGPNFAYEMCVRRTTPEQRQGLDLSRWEWAFCGAEPLHADTVERFLAAFAPYGMRRSAFRPCYGLAEATLIVSSAGASGPLLHPVEAALLEQDRAVPAAPGGPGVRTLVSCGQVLEGLEVAIAEPESNRRLPARTVGEIWVRGPSVAQGYWQQPELTRQVFHARLQGEEDGGWLRTGDLGFRREEGELFVTGRLKDLLILRGRNHYPQDLEQTVEHSHPALRPGCCAAFSVEVEGEEQLVVVQEVNTRAPVDMGEVVAAVRQHLAEAHEVQLHALALLAPGSLPKTSSGKVQRRACREAWQAGTLRSVHAWQGTRVPPVPEQPLPSNPGGSQEALEAWLGAWLAPRVGMQPQAVQPEQALTRYGLDSLAALELAHALQRELGAGVYMEELLRGPSMRELARELLSRRRQGVAPPALARRGTGLPPLLSSTQHRLWRLEQLQPRSPRHHLSVALHLEGPLQVAALEQALCELVRRHESLRTALSAEQERPVPRLSPPPSRLLEHVELRGVPATEWEAEALRRATQEAQRPFSLEHGPLLRSTLLRLGERSHVLVLVLHPIAGDRWSLRVLLRELQALYTALRAGQPSPLPEPPLPYADWLHWQHEPRMGPAPVELESPALRAQARVARTSTSLPVGLWLALKSLARREGATPLMVLLAAFKSLLFHRSGQEEVCVGTLASGRPHAVLEGVVGPFSSPVVLCTRPRAGLSFLELLGAVREAALAAYARQRAAEHTPCQALLVLQQEPMGPLTLPELEVRPLEVHTPTASHELALTFTEGRAGLVASLEYALELLEPAAAEHLLSHLRTLLEAAVANPHRRLSELPQAARAPLPSREEHPALRVESAPLSSIQQRLWFLEQLEPGSALHHLPLALRLEGPLEVAPLRRALAELVRRHEPLRTTFHSEAEGPVQRIHPTLEVALAEVSLELLPVAEREVQVRRQWREEAQRPFTLVRGPLLRATLLRLGEHLHVLLLCLHRLVADEESLRVLVRELGVLYTALRSGQPSPLPEPAVQHARVAARERERQQGQVLHGLLGYWEQQLARLSPLALPTDRPRPALPVHRGAAVRLRVAPGLTEALHALAQEEGVTPLMVLLAAWQVLLWRYTGQEDVGVGMPVAGRTRPELELVVGPLESRVVVRTRVRPSEPFRALLARVRETTLAAWEHQELPYERLVELLRLGRDLSRNPLFQAALELRSRLEPPRMEGLTVEPLEGEVQAVGCDVALRLWEEAQGLAGALEYSVELFERERVARLAGHYQALLGAAVAGPELPVGALPLLTRAERQQVLVEWSGTRAEPPASECLHPLVAAQARRTPELEAVVHGGGGLTYGELLSRARRLAWRLRALGVGPEARVGLLLERTPELVVAVLAVLEAGGAWVPLEPGWPAERLAWVVEDARCQVLVAHARPLRRLARWPCPVVCLEEEGTLAGGPGEPLPGGALPDNLACVLYTSGSAGRPKAVGLTHRGVEALLRQVLALYEPEVLRGVLASSPLTQAPSLFELFAPLARGGRVVLVEELLQLGELPASTGVTLVSTVPSALAQLLGLGRLPATVRGVNLTGEVLPTSLVRQVYAQPGVQRLYNLYGLTESTVYSTSGWVRRGEVPAIGRPLAHTRAYVLDAWLEPVPVGVAGELYLAGASLARGYLEHPELTAERFLPDPYGPAGGRMYRTGDRVRWRREGVLEFVGRVDDQVKVRGHRIEPGEVEAALRRHPAVRETVVVAREDMPGERRLVAYVAVGEAPVEPAELRALLHEQLPAPLVPSVFVLLEALPRTARGEVDKEALPAPERGGVRSAERVAPRTLTEARVAEQWQQLLGGQPVGVEEDFFELGGHSLLVARLVVRLRQALGVELPLRTLLESPTVAAQARQVDAALQASPPGRPVPPLVRLPRGVPIPLNHMQERVWRLYQREPGTPACHVSSAVRLSGRLEVAALERALREVVRRHEALRTTFDEVDGRACQRLAAGFDSPLAVVELPPPPEREQVLRRRREEHVRRPFDLILRPPLRAELLVLGAQEHLLLLTVHQIVFDSVSLEVLVRELAACYTACMEGRRPELPPLPLQYADYAAWQRGWLQGRVLGERLGYWKAQLAGAPVLLGLPVDKPRPAWRTFSGASVPLCLGPERTVALYALCEREGVTLSAVLLAAWGTVLARRAGQEQVLVGTPMGNRVRPELEGLIGLLSNPVALRVDLRGGPAWSELLWRVQDALLGAQAYREVPFDKVVDALGAERPVNRPALCQAFFALQGVPEPVHAAPGLTLQPEPLRRGAAMYELSLVLHEQGGELYGEVEYNTDLFEPATPVRLASALGEALDEMLALLRI